MVSIVSSFIRKPSAMHLKVKHASGFLSVKKVARRSFLLRITLSRLPDPWLRHCFPPVDRSIKWPMSIENTDIRNFLIHGIIIRKYLVPCPRPSASKSFKAASNLLVPKFSSPSSFSLSSFSLFITECFIHLLRLASPPPSQVDGRITSCSLEAFNMRMLI